MTVFEDFVGQAQIIWDVPVILKIQRLSPARKMFEFTALQRLANAFLSYTLQSSKNITFRHS